MLSGGRARLGIGAGYHQAEAEMLGLPLLPTAERFERLEETLRIATQMWRGDEDAFEGEHYRLSRPVNAPQAVRRPPILIGGAGEKKTLRLVAKYADAGNLFDIPDGGVTLTHKLAVLARHCEEVGRPGESAASFSGRCAKLADLGAEPLVVITDGPWTEESITTVADAAR